MIIITGAAGFIGSCLVAQLNEEKIFNLMLVDDFVSAGRQDSSEKKKRNYESKRREPSRCSKHLNYGLQRLIEPGYALVEIDQIRGQVA